MNEGHRSGASAGTPGAIENRGEKSPVAHDIGSDGASYHSNHKHWIGTPARYNQNAGRDARRRPENGHVRRRGEQGEPKPSCQKIDESDGTRRDERSHPPPRRSGGGEQISLTSMKCARRRQSYPENRLSLCQPTIRADTVVSRSTRSCIQVLSVVYWSSKTHGNRCRRKPRWQS